MTRLVAAWRNTSVKRTTGTAPESMMSARTWPGPTEGSWSTSPTSRSAARFGRAQTRAFTNRTSTIDVSSTTRRSQPSGFVSSRLKPPFFGSVSSRRWIVFASTPVVSVRRFAARPVGAQRATATPFATSIFRIELTSVVLPTPGPPVMTRALLDPARRSASRWLAASVIAPRASSQGIARSTSISGQGGSPAARSRSR